MKTAQEYLNQCVYDQLKRWLDITLILFTLFLLTDPFTVPAAHVKEALAIRVVSMSMLFWARKVMNRGDIPVQRSALAANIFGIFLHSITVLYFVIVEDPYFDVYAQLLVLVVGTLLLSVEPAVICAGFVVMSWTAAHLWVCSPISKEQFLLTCSAALLGIYSVITRRVVAIELWDRQSDEKLQSAKLAAALSSAEEAGSLLSAEITQASQEVGQALDELNLNREQRTILHRNLLHSNRLSSLGRLAGGMAHRLNNRLLVLMGTVDNLDFEPYGPESRQCLREVRLAVERGAKLTEQLLPLTGDHLLRARPISVKDLFEQFQPLLKRTTSPLVIENSAPEMWLEVDPQAWYRIVSNLLRNADEATVIDAVIKLVVKSKENSVLFQIEDQGPGVPAEYRERIFEPFFTTKSGTGGTGLGLAVVLGLAEQMGGTISVSDNRAGGATFTVAFEAIDPPAMTPPQTSTTPMVNRLVGQKVLLVEDDPKVLQALQKQLVRMGLQVSTARNGAEGLARFEEEPVGIIITDVVMPTMDGPTMVKELWRRNPDLKVLFTSGYSDDRLKVEGLKTEFNFLPKPYSRESLADSLQKVLM